MRIHYLQHVAFEELGSIETWAARKGHRLTATRLFQEEPLPVVEQFDWLVIMGGPMGADDDEKHAWLKNEKRFIAQAIQRGKTVLGVCLGAQLIAAVLGAQVFPNRFKEIGWFPIRLTEAGEKSAVFGGFPKEFRVFHWHGDTFDLPAGAVRAARSEACENQAFEYERNVVGLQFHLDFTRRSVERLIEHCRADLGAAPYVQAAEAMLAGADCFKQINTMMDELLNRLEARA